ncbi:MAG: tetratricopeptide repeat protein [Planctomycetes bacterium]|nr:tetratricopeptide repeat protein [Planctomycetota bacterium]
MTPDNHLSGPLESCSGAASPHSDAQRLRQFCHAILGVLDATGSDGACSSALPSELARVIGGGIEKVADAVRQEADALAVAVADLRKLPSRFLNLTTALTELEAARVLAVQVADTLDTFRTETPAATLLPLSVKSVAGENRECPKPLPHRDEEFLSLESTSAEPESEALPEPLQFFNLDAAADKDADETHASPTLEMQGSPTLESPIDPSESRQAVRVFLEGEWHHKQQEFDQAEELYTEAIQIDPQFGSAYARRGQIRLAHGSIDKALADFNKALDLDNTAAEALWWRGDAHAVAGQLDKAVEDYTRVLSINPDLNRARFNLAIALRQQGNTKQALVEFTHVIESRPNDAKAYLKRGEIHLKCGNRELAEADFLAALRNEPACEQARHHIASLRKAIPTVPPALPPAAVISPSEPPPKSATTLSIPVPVAPKSSTTLSSTMPLASKSSTRLPRHTGTSSKAGHLSVNCPHCAKVGEVPWDRLSRVFVCQGCGRRFIVQSDGQATEVVEAKDGKWIEAEKVREQLRLRRKRRRTLIATVVIAILFPTLTLAGWRATRPVEQQIVERELPRELKARAELFAQAWMSSDVRLMKRMTSPAVEKTLYSWYNRHRPPPAFRNPTSGVPPEGVDGVQIEVGTRQGKDGRTVVRIQVRNPKLAPDQPPAELTLVWEERSDGNWYFLP